MYVYEIIIHCMKDLIKKIRKQNRKENYNSMRNDVEKRNCNSFK